MERMEKEPLWVIYEMVSLPVTSDYQGPDCCTSGIVGVLSHANAGVASNTT